MCPPKPPKQKATPPPPAPPPPQPEMAPAENSDTSRDGIKRAAAGTEALRIPRSTLGTNEGGGLQVKRKATTSTGGVK